MKYIRNEISSIVLSSLLLWGVASATTWVQENETPINYCSCYHRSLSDEGCVYLDDNSDDKTNYPIKAPPKIHGKTSTRAPKNPFCHGPMVPGKHVFPDGKTRLHYAVIGGSFENVKKILRNPYKGSLIVNVQDDSGKTALHYAVERGDAEIVKFLIDYGAFKWVTDGHGRKPLSYARSNTRSSMRKIFESDSESE